MNADQGKLSLRTRIALTLAYFWLVLMTVASLEFTQSFSGHDISHYYNLPVPNSLLHATLWLGWCCLPIGLALLWFRPWKLTGLWLLLIGSLFFVAFRMFDAYHPRFNFDVLHGRDFVPAHLVWLAFTAMCGFYIYLRECQLRR